MNRNQASSMVENLVDCIALATGDMLRIDTPRDVLVYVAQGRVWITEERAIDDVVLEVEGHHRLRRPGVAIVEALAPAVVFLTAPEASGYARSVQTVERPTAPPRTRRTRTKPAPRPWRPVAQPA